MSIKFKNDIQNRTGENYVIHPVPQNVLDLIQGVLLPYKNHVSWERVLDAILSEDSNPELAPVQDRFLSTEELCDFLHVSRPTVHRYKVAGKITAHKLGRRNLYSVAEVMAAVRGGTADA